MKLIFGILAILHFTQDALSQNKEKDFRSLVKEILAHELPDSVSNQMRSNRCLATVLENDNVKRFKGGARMDKLCILSEEEIFLEDPKFYLDFRKVKIENKISSFDLVVVRRSPFKKSEILKMTIKFEKVENQWKRRSLHFER